MKNIPQTKIVCTLGPACSDLKTLSRMVSAGMNVARINFSHGTHASNKKLIQLVRRVAKKQKKIVAILQDIQGPKMRLGVLPEAGIVISKKQKVIFSTDKNDAQKNDQILVDIPKLETFLKKGERILIADGSVEVVVKKIMKKRIETSVVVGGTLFSHKGLNFPDSKIPLRPLTDKDKDDLLFGAGLGVDFVAVSFVQSAKDVVDVKKFLYKNGISVNKMPNIIAKIERQEAVDNIDSILDFADGIMVARGDLGLEVPTEEVPVIQKTLIRSALLKQRSVIVATQMLDSMQRSPRPTRAEVSDVANAVIDHTDAVMLSDETASGEYPVESLEMMYKIIEETEKSSYDDLKDHKIDESISILSSHIGEIENLGAIVVLSESNIDIRSISRQRFEVPLYLIVHSEVEARKALLYWGVIPVIIKKQKTHEKTMVKCLDYLKTNKIIAKKQPIVTVLSGLVGEKHLTHTIQLFYS